MYVFVLASSLSALLDVLGCVLSCLFVREAVILVVGWADLLIGVIFQDVDLTWPGQRIPRIPDFVCVCGMSAGAVPGKQTQVCLCSGAVSCRLF